MCSHKTVDLRLRMSSRRWCESLSAIRRLGATTAARRCDIAIDIRTATCHADLETLSRRYAAARDRRDRDALLSVFDTDASMRVEQLGPENKQRTNWPCWCRPSVPRQGVDRSTLTEQLPPHAQARIGHHSGGDTSHRQQRFLRPRAASAR